MGTRYGADNGLLLAHIDSYPLYCLSDEKLKNADNSYRLLAVMEGNGMLETGNCVYLMGKGAIYLCPPSQEFGLSADSPSALACTVISFNLYQPTRTDGTVKNWMNEAGLPNKPMEAADFARLADLLRRMLAYSRAAGAEWLKRQSTLYEIAEWFLPSQAEEAPVSDNRQSVILEAASYLRRNYDKAIEREGLAEKAELSAVHFSRLFRMGTGMSPIAYLTRIRINRAKELLLLENRPSVKAVAEAVGYADELYFSRLFKKHTGLPPSRYPDTPPIRIATAWSPLTYYLMALGVTPCAGQEDGILPHHRNPDATQYVSLGAGQAWDRKTATLRAQKPDLILSYDFQKGVREELRLAAPVAVIPWSTCGLFEQLRKVARYIDREEKAEKWIAVHEARTAEIRARLNEGRELDETWAIWMLYDGSIFRAYGNRNIGHVFYNSLQLRPPKEISANLAIDPQFGFVPIEEHTMAGYQGDHILLMLNNQSESARSRWEQLRHSQAWLELPAVQANQVCVMDANQFLLYDPLSIENQLEEAERVLAVYLKGGYDQNVHARARRF